MACGSCSYCLPLYLCCVVHIFYGEVELPTEINQKGAHAMPLLWSLLLSNHVHVLIQQRVVLIKGLNLCIMGIFGFLRKYSVLIIIIKVFG